MFQDELVFHEELVFQDELVFHEELVFHDELVLCVAAALYCDAADVAVWFATAALFQSK